MTAAQPDRLDRIEALLERSIQQSNERQTRMESAITELSQTQLRIMDLIRPTFDPLPQPLSQNGRGELEFLILLSCPSSPLVGEGARG